MGDFDAQKFRRVRGRVQRLSEPWLGGCWVEYWEGDQITLRTQPGAPRLLGEKVMVLLEGDEAAVFTAQVQSESSYGQGGTRLECKASVQPRLVQAPHPPRFVMTDLTARVKDTHGQVIADVVDLSNEGMAIHTGVSYAPGTMIEVTMGRGNLEKVMRGKVRYSVPEPFCDGIYRSGVQFLSTYSLNRNEIEQLSDAA
ncbi:MAG: PilZ domain-containing protein [Armatimonadetes bacterium]|nr:PilZ domain-containing protein [Armatimonadota bacterium]